MVKEEKSFLKFLYHYLIEVDIHYYRTHIVQLLVLGFTNR